MHKRSFNSVLIVDLGDPVYFLGSKRLFHLHAEFFLAVVHECHKVFVHRCPEALLVLLRRNNRGLSLRDFLLHEGFELLVESVLLDVIDNAQSDRALLRVNDHEERIVND